VYSFRGLPAPARAIAEAATETVTAARARDPGAFEEAAEGLAALDPEQAGIVLGAVVRSLLEELHPDGLTGDDVGTVLGRCTRSAMEWCPGVDADVLLALLAGALGIHPSDEEPRPPGGPAVARHAPLLIADLTTVSGRPVAGYLHAAFAEIARAETVELP
jgi:hypothetical protein